MAMIDFKCYPCMKAFDFTKIIISIVLFGLSTMMLIEQGSSMTCGRLAAGCPDKVDRLRSLVDPSYGTPSNDSLMTTNRYCQCVGDCINYYLVYQDDLENPDETNCYQRGWEAGIPKVGSVSRRLAGIPFPNLMGNEDSTDDDENSMGFLNAVRRRLMRFVPADEGMVGASLTDKCDSCASMKHNQHQNYLFLGLVAGASGAFLFISAVCEIKGVRMHNCCFHWTTVLFDTLAMVGLFTATIIAFLANVLGMMACNSHKWSPELQAASEISSSSHVAVFNFFLDLFGPLYSGLCKEKPKFFLFWISCALGLACMIISACIHTCITCGLTDDGEEDSDGELEPHDLEVRQLQKLSRGPGIYDAYE